MKNPKLIVMTLVIVIVVVITFFNQRSTILQEITNTAKDEEVQINRYVDLCKGFVDLMTIYSNNWFDNAQSGDSELYDLLQYDADTGRYNLDAIAGTKYQKIAGNLTGLAGMPAQGVYRNEINLAFALNQQFTSIYAKLPDVAWLYYSSNNNFINLYPWVPSSEFAYSEIVKTEVFFANAIPENNPLRQSFWTPVYLDHAGKGLMVTLSSPIYNQDQFMGVVSIDLTNNQISEMIQSAYTTFVIDDTNTVIASNTGIPFDQDVIKLEDLLQITPDKAAQIKALAGNSLQTLSGFYIYAVDVTNAPWRMFIRVSIWD